MAEEVVIKAVLDLRESAQRVKTAIEDPKVAASARDAGRKIGQELSLGIETGRNRQSAEAKELAHQRRLESIHLQSGARLQQIEARRLAQLDLLRERSMQKEIERQRQLERAIQSSAGAVGSFHGVVGAAATVLAGLATAGIAAGVAVKRFADISIQAAVDVNKQVNALKALTGSAEAAEKRFAALFALAQKTPGLTTSLATTLDAQLRVFSVAEKTIDRLLPVIGRLNAISPLSDPRQFVNNLTQLISQNFERQDLKELVGQSPIAGLLIKDIFDVDNPTNAAAIRTAAKRLGVTTVERLAEELIKASANNSALQNATESFAGQFAKLQDRITVALAPIGEELLKVIMPAVKELVNILEREAPKITALIRNNKEEFIALASAVVTVANAVGQLIGVFNTLDQQFGIVRALSLLAVSIANPGAAATLSNAFDRIDRTPRLNPLQRQQFATARGDLSALPPTADLRSFAQSTGDLRLLSTLGPDPRAASRTTAAASTASGDRSRRTKRETNLLSAASVQRRELFDRAELEKAQERQMDALAQEFREQSERFAQQRETRRRLTAELAVQESETLLRTSRRSFARSGRFIDAATDRGQLTVGEAELLGKGAAGEFANQLRGIVEQEEKLQRLRPEAIEDLKEEVSLYDQLSVSVSNTERFMRGFNSQVDSVGDAFDRFGQNVSSAFRNVRDLFSGLKQAVLGFFNDLVGQSLQNLVRNTLGGLFGNLSKSLGGAGGGNLFRTPSTFGNFAQAFAGAAGGGGISAPPSITATQEILGELSGATRPRRVSDTIGSIAGGGAATGGGFSFGNLLGGLASSAPLLGLGLGSGFGGQSVAGQILGAAGGAAVGLGVSFGSAVFGAGGGLGQAALAALGPIALLGAPLLIGASLLGRAKQRRQDEEASGQMLTRALQGIDQLAQAVSAGQITTLAEARSIFDSQILGTFRQQIGQLKTKSVRESRLTNQVRDLRNVFEARIPPLLAEQERKATDARRFAAIDSRLVPQFAAGGFVPGINRGFDSVVARLTPGELVLNRVQQLAVMAQAGPGVFDRVGVPRTPIYTGGAQAMQVGGYATPMGRGQGGGAMVIQLDVQLGMTDQDSQQILARAMNSRTGEDIVVELNQRARRRRRS